MILEVRGVRFSAVLCGLAGDGTHY